MKAITTPRSYIFVYFPDARETGLKEEKGYRVQFGEVEYEGKLHAVPKWIEYFKDKFSYEEAKHFAQQITTCEICEKINANVGIIESIENSTELQDNYIRPPTTSRNNDLVLNKLAKLSEDVNELKTRAKSPVDEAEYLYSEIAMDVLTSQFTAPGLLELAIVSKNPKLIRKILPKSDDERLELKAQMAEYLAGDISRVKTPEQMRVYAKAERDMIKAMHGEEVEEEETPKKKKTIGSFRRGMV